MQVIAVNHGNVFGTGKWFTFYCGKCERQLNAGEKKCKHCGEKSLYEGAKNLADCRCNVLITCFSQVELLVGLLSYPLSIQHNTPLPLCC